MKKNILLLEDNILIRDSLIKLIEKNCGDYFHVYTAHQYSTALKLSQEVLIDIFIIDIELGKKRNGIQFAQEIRNIEQYRHTPLIFETADFNSIAHVVNSVHCHGYLVKPYNSKDLINLLAPFMQNSSQPFKIDEKNHFVTIDLDAKNVHLDATFYKVQVGASIFTQIRLADILYLEAFQKKVIIHSLEEDLETRFLTLSKFMADNKGRYFHRCHNSFVLNTYFVTGYGRSIKHLILKHSEDEYEFNIGRRWLSETRRRYPIK